MFHTSYSRSFENLHAANGEEIVCLGKISFIINKSLPFAFRYLTIWVFPSFYYFHK